MGAGNQPSTNPRVQPVSIDPVAAGGLNAVAAGGLNAAAVAPEAPSNTVYLSDWIDGLSELERYKAPGDSKFLSEYLADAENTIPVSVKLEFIRVLQRTESQNADSTVIARLAELESYYERKVNFQNEKPIATASQIPTSLHLDESFSSIFTQLKDRSEQLRDSRQDYGAVGLTGRGLEMAGSATSAVLDGFRNLSTPAQLGVLAVGIFALYKAVRSSGVRNFLLQGGKVVGGLWLGNEILRSASGRGALEHFDSWMIRRNEALMTHFAVNLENDEQVKSFDLLMESILDNNGLGNNTFKNVIAAHGSARGGRMPDSVLNGVEFETEPNPELAAVTFHRSVTLLTNKYGPRSFNYVNNPKIKNLWNRLMLGDVSWRQGVMDLLAADELAPNDLLPTFPETAGYIASNAYEFTTRSASFLTGAAIGAIPDSWTNQFAEFKDWAKDSLSEQIFDSGNQVVNNKFNQRLRTLNDIGTFEHQFGAFALTALNSPNQIYTDASGISYYTANDTMTQAQFDSNTARLDSISLHLRNYISKLSNTYTTDQIRGGRIELLFGAEIPNSSGGGNYVTSFAFIPEAHPNNVGLLLDRSCFTDEISGTVSDFRLNAYERSYLREYFQLANDSDMTRVLTHIRENHVPVGTVLADIPNRIFTENVRTSVMQMLGRPFDSVRWDYYNDLLAVNVELTREDRIKFLSLNSLLVNVARNDQAYLRALGFSSLYGTIEFKTQYRAYATRLLAPPATTT